MFFSYYGEMPEGTFTIDDVPMKIDLLRPWLRAEHPESSTIITTTGKEFRENFYAKLGGLQTKFADLFRKAVPFNPISDIQKFITEFVFGNEQAVDIRSMQETIESYTELEKEAKGLQERKELLQKIEAVYAEYGKFTEQAKLHHYIADNAACDIAKRDLEEKEQQLVELENKLEQQKAEVYQLDRQYKEANSAYTVAYSEMKSSGLQKQIEDLEQSIEALTWQIAQWNDNYDRRNRSFTVLTAGWYEMLRLCRNLPREDSDGFSDRTRASLETFREEQEAAADVEKLAQQPLEQADFETVKTCNMRMQALHDGVNLLLKDMDEDQRTNAAKKAELNEERTVLLAGRQQYPRTVVQLQETIRQRLQTRESAPVNVRVVAELWDVRNPAWRNAIEGYLNTQRYNLLVPAEQYQAAVRIYNDVKDTMRIHGVAVVDIAAVRRAAPVCREGSLAEEIVAEDEDARLYANFLLGRVMKCTDIAQHNRQDISITQEGMLYQGKAIRRLNPEVWAHPLLGQGARELRLRQVEEELRRYQQISSTLAVWHNRLEAIRSLQKNALGANDLEDWQDARADLAKIPAAQQQIKEKQAELAEIDRSPLDAMDAKVKALEKRAAELSTQKTAAAREADRTERDCEIYQNDKIPEAKQHWNTLQQQIKASYEAVWQEQIADPRYQSAVASHASLQEVCNNYTNSARGSQTLAEKKQNELRDARSEYNRLYKMGYDVDKADNADYAQTLQEILENRLPEYQEKIRDAKEKAHEQFLDEFIGVLYNNIRNARRAIDSLNAALQAPFSEDRYAFTVSPAPEYKRYYDMLTDPLYMDDYNLFSNPFRTKYAQEIAELTAALTDTQTADIDKRVALYTNYRTYLDFDLTVTSPDGTVQRLSRTMSKKSGGETQTPFYIAVLTSFAQIYRMNSDPNASTIRLIVFDEAFSKMDGDRIAQSIHILRKFNFQVLFAAPEEKIGDIAPLVDRNLCALRKEHTIVIRPFDPRKVLYETV